MLALFAFLASVLASLSNPWLYVGCQEDEILAIDPIYGMHACVAYDDLPANTRWRD